MATKKGNLRAITLAGLLIFAVVASIGITTPSPPSTICLIAKKVSASLKPDAIVSIGLTALRKKICSKDEAPLDHCFGPGCETPPDEPLRPGVCVKAHEIGADCFDGIDNDADGQIDMPQESNGGNSPQGDPDCCPRSPDPCEVAAIGLHGGCGYIADANCIKCQTQLDCISHNEDGSTTRGSCVSYRCRFLDSGEML